jgi:hypothetical protein
MDGCTRQNPAYRSANGGAPGRGLLSFLVLGAAAVTLGAAGADRAAGAPPGPLGGSYSSTWGECRSSASDQASFMYRFEEMIPTRHEG